MQALNTEICIMEEVNSITDRFLMTYNHLFDLKRVSSPADFAKKIGISSSMMTEIAKKRSKVGIKAIQNTVLKFPSINPNWLITGRGKMTEFYLPEPNYSKEPQEEYAIQTQGIPLLPAEALAGLGNISITIMKYDIQERYVVPDFSNVDFMIRVKGSSMYPKYNSGDVVACVLIKESTFLQWGKVHVLHTKEQGCLVKRLFETDDKNTIECRSDNESYPPFIVEKNEITNIALVVGAIRLE